ncbi:MAG: hypothetical protein IRZ08_15935 [Frankia sp.]|nr:hypothetical protein [Frankia sp.]
MLSTNASFHGVGLGVGLGRTEERTGDLLLSAVPAPAALALCGALPKLDPPAVRPWAHESASAVIATAVDAAAVLAAWQADEAEQAAGAAWAGASAAAQAAGEQSALLPAVDARFGRRDARAVAMPRKYAARMHALMRGPSLTEAPV